MKKYQILFFYSETLSYIEIDFICRRNMTKDEIYNELISKGYDHDIFVNEIE